MRRPKQEAEQNKYQIKRMKTVFSEENYVRPQPTIGSGDRVQIRLIFTVFIVW